MAGVEELWEQLEEIRELVGENPPEGRKAADVALAMLAELDDAPPDLCAFTVQIDGTAWRANGQYEDAERCYLRAGAIYRDALAYCEDFARHPGGRSPTCSPRPLPSAPSLS